MEAAAAVVVVGEGKGEVVLEVAVDQEVQVEDKPAQEAQALEIMWDSATSVVDMVTAHLVLAPALNMEHLSRHPPQRRQTVSPCLVKMTRTLVFVASPVVMDIVPPLPVLPNEV